VSLDGSFAGESVRKCLASQVENEDRSEHLTLFTRAEHEPNVIREFPENRRGMKATSYLLW